ncbi:MAG: trypsin-like peptidase domain-containing protein [Desulfobacteraceae bacterium]|nr:trypsin-like peptidase domain-containing protein [Desulfobacteraceae bacterium]
MDEYGVDILLKSLVKIIEPEKNEVIGSGFIIRSDGYLITCHHVISTLNELKAEYQGKQYKAEWCGDLSDPGVDIAVLKIDIENASEVSIVVPKDLPEKVILCGYPRSKIANFPEGFDIHAQNICRSSPVNTLSTYSPFHKIKHSNPWNTLPSEEATFSSLKIDTKVDSGISGGPVFSEELFGVIGIIQSAGKDIAGKDKSYAIRWENISDKLKVLGIISKKSSKQNVMNIAETLAEKYDFHDLRAIAKELGMSLSKMKPNPTNQEFAHDIEDWVIREHKPELSKKLEKIALQTSR